MLTELLRLCSESQHKFDSALANNKATGQPIPNEIYDLRPAPAVMLMGHTALALAEYGLGSIQNSITQLTRVLHYINNIPAFGITYGIEHYLSSLQSIEDVVYSVAISHPTDSSARSLAATCALLRKGTTFDVQNQLKYSGNKERHLIDELQRLRSRLSNIALRRAMLGRSEALDIALEETSTSIINIDRSLSTQNHLRWQITQSLLKINPDQILDNMKQALPRDGALLEYIRFRKIDFNAENKWNHRHDENNNYLAIVVNPDRDVELKDLGPAEWIDQATERLLVAVTTPSTIPYVAGSKAYELLIDPIASSIRGKKRLFIVPDGSINNIPFEVLRTSGHFLQDDFVFTYFNSGRDLAWSSIPVTTKRPGTVLVLAAPAFGSSSIDPLLGTLLEAQMIKKAFAQASVRVGAEASTEALLSASGTSIIHLATHGLFIGMSYGSGEDRGLRPEMVLGTPDVSPFQRAESDPMTRSAILMAGAATKLAAPQHLWQSEADDGVVTAMEVLNMDLSETELVVLSACDTGRGGLQPGQGIYGLRRAFMLAGAETVVTSLWQVNDLATAELMQNFYMNLRQGEGRSEAMRNASRSIRDKWPHPKYWAPFVVAGRGAPLSFVQ
ncbi:CHAT domain-containing protein [Sorangium sp. So ce861]|uniref:CHAT domain-containing protein n=1 Tax=Sorangium sp. So ce861 TaxID=3133323 RepID=UPI003F6020E0